MNDFGDGFGWDGMGDPMGAWNPVWGALAGSAVGTGTAIATRQYAKTIPWKKYAELVGLGANALVSIAGMFYGPSRAASWTSLAAGLGNHVPRALEDVLINYAASSGVVGMASIQRVGRAVGVHGSGMGMPVMEPTRQAELLGQAGERARLLGAAESTGAQSRLMGGPAFSTIGNHFGSSIVGARAR